MVKDTDNHFEGMLMEYKDLYISEDLPPETHGKRASLLRMVYKEDYETQPHCPNCGRPMYYRLNEKTGAVELYCKVCSA